MRFLKIGALLAVSCSSWGAEVPRPSPPFTIVRKAAPSIDPKQYRGKVVALAFIYTTCPHCQDLTRSLNALSREFTGKPVQFLECAFNPDAEMNMPDFLALLHPPFPVGWSYQAPVRTYLKVSMMDAHFMVPHMVFLDRNGVIQLEVDAQDKFFQGADGNIRDALNRLLNPPAAKTAVPAKK